MIWRPRRRADGWTGPRPRFALWPTKLGDVWVWLEPYRVDFRVNDGKITAKNVYHPRVGAAFYVKNWYEMPGYGVAAVWDLVSLNRAAP